MAWKHTFSIKRLSNSSTQGVPPQGDLLPNKHLLLESQHFYLHWLGEVTR